MKYDSLFFWFFNIECYRELRYEFKWSTGFIKKLFLSWSSFRMYFYMVLNLLVIYVNHFFVFKQLNIADNLFMWTLIALAYVEKTKIVFLSILGVLRGKNFIFRNIHRGCQMKITGLGFISRNILGLI